MPKHYIPRTESELGDFEERISRFLHARFTDSLVILQGTRIRNVHIDV